LARSKRFTSTGMTVIAAMETAVASWPGMQPAGYPAILADDLVSDHLIRWRLRNLLPRDRDIARLVTAWSNDRHPPSVPRATLGPDHRESFAEDSRPRLAYRALADGAPPGSGMSKAPASRADLHLISGEYQAASAAYQAEIGAGHGSPGTWAGLAVARRRLVGEGSDAIIMRPELVRALYSRLSADSAHAPSPLDIAHWLAPACLDEQEPDPGEPRGVYLPVTSKALQNRIPPGDRAPR